MTIFQFFNTLYDWSKKSIQIYRYTDIQAEPGESDIFKVERADVDGIMRSAVCKQVGLKCVNFNQKSPLQFPNFLDCLYWQFWNSRVKFKGYTSQKSFR